MCGIVGMAGVIGVDDEKAMENLLILDCLRGVDSLGVASVSSTYDSPSVFKRAMNPLDYLQMPQWKEMRRKVNRVFIGHNRWATKGVVISENAHPFQHGSITGVHNGTLSQQHLLPDHQKFAVDSENIMYAIDLIGIEETAKKLAGAYALVWWDKANSNLHFLRNSQRPLTYCLSEDERTIYYASEPAMLEAALVRNNIKHKQITNTATETLYTINIPNRMGGVKAEKLTINRTKLEVYKAPVSTGNSYWRDGSTYYTSGNSSVTVTTSTSKPRRELPAKSGKTITFRLSGTTSTANCYKARGTTTCKDHYPVTLVFANKEEYEKYHIDFSCIYTGVVKHIGWDLSHDSMSYHIETGTVFYYSDDFVDDDGALVLDDDGEGITREEYKERYPKCWCCGRDLAYTAENEIIDAEYALCPICSNDPRAFQLLNNS